MKTFNTIEFDGETVTLHGVGRFGYSESFDIDLVESASASGCVFFGGRVFLSNGLQCIDERCDIATRIAYAKSRFKPADFSFKELLGSV